jgi:hypothetical protein
MLISFPFDILPDSCTYMIFGIGHELSFDMTVPEVSYCGSSDDMIVPQNSTLCASLSPLYIHYLSLLSKVTTPSYNLYEHVKCFDCLSHVMEIF